MNNFTNDLLKKYENQKVQISQARPFGYCMNDNNQNIITSACDNSNNQQFTIVKENDYFLLKNQNNMCANLSENGLTLGNCKENGITPPTRKIIVKNINNNQYTLGSQNNQNLCIQSSNSVSNPYVLRTCNENNEYQHNFIAKSTGQLGANEEFIKKYNNKKVELSFPEGNCMDNIGGVHGSQIQAKVCDNNQNQRFNIVKENDYFLIKNQNNNTCIDFYLSNNDGPLLSANCKENGVTPPARKIIIADKKNDKYVFASKENPNMCINNTNIGGYTIHQCDKNNKQWIQVKDDKDLQLTQSLSPATGHTVLMKMNIKNNGMCLDSNGGGNSVPASGKECNDSNSQKFVIEEDKNYFVIRNSDNNTCLRLTDDKLISGPCYTGSGQSNYGAKMTAKKNINGKYVIGNNSSCIEFNGNNILASPCANQINETTKGQFLNITPTSDSNPNENVNAQTEFMRDLRNAKVNIKTGTICMDNYGGGHGMDMGSNTCYPQNGSQQFIIKPEYDYFLIKNISGGNTCLDFYMNSPGPVLSAECEDNNKNTYQTRKLMAKMKRIMINDNNDQYMITPKDNPNICLKKNGSKYISEKCNIDDDLQWHTFTKI